MTTRSWQVGEVTVTRVVELSAVRTPEFGYRNLTTEQILEQSWLRPHFATEDGRLKSCIQAFIVETGRRKDHRRYLRRQRQGARQSGLARDGGAVPRRPGGGRRAGGEHRHGALHPFACGPCGLEHAPGRRPVGPDLRQRALSFRGGGMGPLEPRADRAGGGAMWTWRPRPVSSMAPPSTRIRSVPLSPPACTSWCRAISRSRTRSIWSPPPGTRPGHVSVVIESAGARAVITGDLMHHPIQCALPEVSSKFDHDVARALETRRQFLERYGDRDVLVFGTHFAAPTRRPSGQPRRGLAFGARGGGPERAFPAFLGTRTEFASAN